MKAKLCKTGQLVRDADGFYGVVEKSGERLELDRWDGPRTALDPNATVYAVPHHGTTLAYNEGCRCELCRAANTKSHSAWKARRAGKVPCS